MTLGMISFRRSARILSFALVFLCMSFLAGALSPALAASYRTPTASELYGMMRNLMSPSFSELKKKRMAAVLFVHMVVYRNAVIRGEFPADDEAVKGFLKAKEELQQDEPGSIGQIS